MTTEHDQGDYVLVHKSKAKISRARKMIIGVMAIGAVAALTGAGTFASFTAQTTNAATFQTARLELSNKQIGGTCFSGGLVGNTATANATNLDLNNNTGCDALFNGFIEPGTIATAGIDLSNVNSNTPADLYVYTRNGCVESLVVNLPSNAGSDTLCDDIQLIIQTATDANYNSGLTCVYPAVSCTGSPGNLADFVTNHGAFGTAQLIQGGFGDTNSTNNAVTDHKFMLVTMKLPHGDAATGGADTGCPGGFGATATDEISINGVGCDNVYMNRQALFDLTWRLIEP